MDGKSIQVSDGSSTITRETATWVRWTSDGRLQQRWWVEEETPTSRRAYEDWRDVPTLETTTG